MTANTLSYSDIYLILMIWFTALATLVVVRILPLLRRDDEKVISDLKKRIKELEEKLLSEKNRCDELLRDAAVKNAMMVSLFTAYTKGWLDECYEKKGRIRLLADGTAMCELPDPSKSYVILGGSDGK